MDGLVRNVRYLKNVFYAGEVETRALSGVHFEIHQ